MCEQCTDDRFKVIEIARYHILNATNVKTSPDEMKVLDNFLFRCWQMGWLDKYYKPDCTRYDLDAVLALLEKERCLAHDKCDGGASYRAYSKAIEIVEGGAE